MTKLTLVVVFGACTAAPIEMRFVPPANATQWDTSCVTNIEVRAVGTHYPIDATDYRATTLTLPTGAATFSAIESLVHDKVQLDIPQSGLAGIAMMGWAVPTGFQPSNVWYPTPELAFFAENNYLGQDTIEVQAVPNASCTKKPVSVRIVDMFALVLSGGTSGCAAAMTMADNSSWSGAGTIVPRPFGAGLEFYGDVNFGVAMSNLVQFSAQTQIGPDSCLALTGADNTGTSTGCVIDGPTVCAGAGELEIAATNYNAFGAADQSLSKTMPDMTIGSVWSSAKTLVAGATVSVDAKHAKVFYIDPHADGTFAVRGDQSGTGPSGMFVLYADAIVSATIKGGGQARTVTLGATAHSTAGAMIVL